MKRFFAALLFLIAAATSAPAQFNNCGAGFCPGIFGNGFNVSGALAFSPLVLPGSPLAVCSSIRLASWSGNWGRVQRADTTQLDIGFIGNAVDWHSALNFAQGSALTVAKCYDQSGNGNDFTQPTAANQPDFSTLNLVNGIAPIVIDGYWDNYNSTSPRSLLIPSTISANLQAFSVLMAIRQVTSYEFGVFYEFTNGATTNFSEFLFPNPAGLPGVVTNNAGTTFNFSTTRPRALMTVLGVTSGAANQIIVNNGVSVTQTAPSSVTMNGGGQIGASISGSPAGQFNGQFDLFAIAIYGSQLSTGNTSSVVSAYNTAFSVPQSFTTRLIYGGSSLITGLGSSYNQNVIRQENLPLNVEIYNMSIPGQTVATECSGQVESDELGMYDATKASNIFVIDAPSNDIAGQTFANSAAASTFADNLYNNTTVPCVAARLAAGATAHVVVPTIISRSGFDTTSNFFETARIEYNSKVVAGAVANGYSVADRAGNSLIGCQSCNTNQTYFYVDDIHLNNTGYAVMAPIDGGAIIPFIR